MNEHFVCIKVDREEHPDVDHMYMDAVQAIGGSGGWPLNVFVTPEKAPFYGGTYYPPRAAYNRPSWMQLLQRMTELWEDEHDQVSQQAEQMIQHLKQASQRMTFSSKDSAIVGKEACRKIAENLLKQADKELGGFGNAPKFPGTMAISFLLEHYHFTGYKPALEHALRSLDAMSDGGIYDQLGGGFARYATDRNWLIPHFEKMLYDNALLIGSLCDAWSITKDERYKITAEETIAFIERELKDKSGGYYCALDADSEGVEGKFYTWTWDVWIAALGEHDAVVAQYFGVSAHGNWEETNILHIANGIAKVAAENNLTTDEVKTRIEAAKHKLLNQRNTRVRPMTDDKCLLSWNALYNIALSKAGVAFRDESYLTLATAHMRWMTTRFENDGKLLHTWKNGTAKIPAKLDDYAYLAQAMLQLASASGANDLVLHAGELTATVIREFSTGNAAENAFFFYTAETQTDIPVRKVDLYDGATPSANALMAHNLWLCGMCLERSEWIAKAQLMWHNMNDTAVRYSQSFGYWALMLQRHTAGLKTLISTGSKADDPRPEIQKNYLPQVYTLTSQKEISELPIFEKKFFADKMYIFVCTEQACLSPVSTVTGALQLINNLSNSIKS